MHSDLNNNTTVITQDSNYNVTPRPRAGPAVSGLGGIGKSELAKAYARKYYSNEYYHNAIWIDGEKEESIMKSFHELDQYIPGLKYLKKSGRDATTTLRVM